MKTTKATENTLTRWTRPQRYVGATWEDYFQSGVGQSRDSDALERANFDAMRAALAAIPTPADWPHDFAPWQVVSENHWAVGWVEWIAIHESAMDHLLRASEISQALENYSVVDESLFSEYEQSDANEIWRNCYRPKERIEWIRRHRSQFQFRDLADMLGCIRGNYFAGYASELLN